MAQDKTPAQVAQTATVTVQGSLKGLILLGTFGAEGAPKALIQLPGGKTESVTVGDRVDGNPVLAIETGRIAIQNRGAAQWIVQPGAG